MRRIVGSLSAVLFACTSSTVITALPAGASVAAIDAVTCSSYSWNYRRVFNNPPVISAPITCTATGGVAPYTYNWLNVGGDQVTKPTSQFANSTSFKRGVANGGDWISYWRLYAFDSVGSIAASPLVTVEVEWENGQ